MSGRPPPRAPACTLRALLHSCGSPGVWEMAWSFAGPEGRSTFERIEIDGEAVIRWRCIGAHAIFGAQKATAFRGVDALHRKGSAADQAVGRCHQTINESDTCVWPMVGSAHHSGKGEFR